MEYVQISNFEHTPKTWVKYGLYLYFPPRAIKQWGNASLGYVKMSIYFRDGNP